jgi:4a-hydroxytetrahydrobiopterin dehydratase
VLSPSDLAQHLAALTGWKQHNKQIAKTFRFANYYETIAFVNAIAYVSHQQDHHPDLSVHFNHVDVVYSTHDAGGVTLNDCICAAKVETLSSG